MKAEIITIGDELLIGQVVDTNSAWMAQRLNDEGIELYQITSVHDNREHILSALDEAFSRVDIVLTTGGLGPTKDDITKNVMCEYFGTQLVEDPHVRAHIHELYKDRPEALNRLTATQWQVPQSAIILPNRVGSAPIMVFENKVEGEGQNSKFLIAMPGVPHEMKIAMIEQVLPFIRLKVIGERLKAMDIVHKTILVHGIPESKLAILIEDWENTLPSSIRLAYLPKDGFIRLRLSSYGEVTSIEILTYIDTLLPLISDYLLATEDRGDLGQFDLTNTGEVVDDLLLLMAQLLFIGQYLPFATTALTIVFTYGFATHGRRFYDSLNTTFHKRVLLACHLYIHDISGHAVGHKQHHIIHAREGFALCRNPRDLNVFQQW